MIRKHAYINDGGDEACAFCKRWYDPANSAIRPKQVRAGNREYDRNAANACMDCKRGRHEWRPRNKSESKR